MSDSGKAIIDSGMNGYVNASPNNKRAIAVAAALELIQTRVGTSTYAGVLDSELNDLSSYADTIQEALKVK